MKKTIASLMLGLSLITAQAHAQSSADLSKLSKISVTYVASPFNVPSIVMRSKGYLQEAFKPMGIAIDSPEITSGAKQTQALAAGEVHIASVLGGSSAILASANGVDVKVIAAYSRSPKAFGIWAPANGASDIRALKGKTVAGPKGTTLHQLLAAALTRNGMRLSDIEHVNMDLPAARTALLAGQVDAATLAGNNALAVEKAGARLLADGQGLIEPTTVIAVRGDLLQKRPDIVKAYLGAHRKALDFMKSNPEEALKLAADEQKISIEDARKMLTFYNFELRMSEQDVKNLAADQDFMIEAGMLKNRIDIRKNMLAPIAFEQK